MLPRFELVARLRPIDLVSPGSVLVDEPAVCGEASWPTPHPAPYAALATWLRPGDAAPVRLSLTGPGGERLAVVVAEGRVGLEVEAGDEATRHRSRRHGRVGGEVRAVGLTLTGPHLTALTWEVAVGSGKGPGRWVVRGRVDLTERLDTRDEAWLTGLTSTVSRPEGAAPARVVAGGFGQLGLRDLRLVTHADGTAYRPSGEGDRTVLLTASSAGPGFFDTAHTSVWELDLGTPSPELRHRSDLFFRRPDRAGAFGDHATHLVRDGDRWLVATSTWGDFDRACPDARVGVTLAEVPAGPGQGPDLLSGRHLLDTRSLPLPTEGLTSVGVWDPHLVRTGDGWLVGYVSARRFFRFHPAVAAGPTLDDLALRAAAGDRRATEGTTLVRLDGQWRVLASDGADGRAGQRRRYPVFDLDLREVGEVDAPHLGNIPWPTLVRTGTGDGDWAMVAFDGTPCGGPLAGYGTHGDVLVMRGAGRPSPPLESM